MQRIRVAVLRGGPSNEYEVSLASGASVLKNLPENYRATDVLIDREGRWHVGGMPTTPGWISRHHDVVFNALHGQYGEDGKVQQLFDALGVPYTASGALASAIGMHKVMTKERLRGAGFCLPRHLVFGPDEAEEDMREIPQRIFKTIAPPWVIKPLRGGSSVGVEIVRKIGDLSEALERTRAIADELLVEEYIRGREATVGVIDGFRGQRYYALMPIEIVPPMHHSSILQNARMNKGEINFFDYVAKYGDETKFLCPATFSHEIKKQLEELAVRAHQVLGLRHYSRSDFIVTPSSRIYFLEINTQPGLTEHSLIPKALHAAGSSLKEFLGHILELAQK